MDRRTKRQTLHTATSLIMLAIMAIGSFVGPSVVLCTEFDGRTHLEFGRNECCSADAVRATTTESTSCLSERDDHGGCVDCTDISLSSGQSTVPRWRPFDGITSCLQPCTFAVVDAISPFSQFDRLDIRGFPAARRSRDPVSRFVKLRLNC